MDSLMMVYAFRYALGRKTYIVGHVVGQIIEHKEDLNDTLRHLMIKEIESAIEGGDAGMDCDVQQWTRLRDVLLSEGKKGE